MRNWQFGLQPVGKNIPWSETYCLPFRGTLKIRDLMVKREGFILCHFLRCPHPHPRHKSEQRGQVKGFKSGPL